MTEPSLLGGLLRIGFDRMVRHELRGVYLRGGLPVGPFVWAANHHSWWDPFVASAVLHRAGRPACLLMLQENLDRYRFFRHAGVFGTAELGTGLRLLARGRTLVIFPEGELRPAAPPGPLSPGAAWYADRAGLPLLSVAVRVVLRGHDRPEAYVSCTEVPAKGRIAHTTERLTETLAQDLANLDGQLAVADPRTPLAGFRRVVAGRVARDERIDRLTGALPWRS
ncbi:lysophospholipid acyltransferase family protein [Catellatospora tritici]|uniref:lysophospholipid acyltransferase family protein n=1 Tax=Catellatospora tritici TaxID=2851566 RepID=UPI001C2DE8B6|nr:lysophospholipid acyltransferase family protein [Catellatospora tritici]MBV1850131.1 1-acyl-sn-glycerol-3-phosphate acyltransferase [Catellatospora tritici]